MGVTSDTQDLIARLWGRFQPLAVERVAVIAGFVRGEADGANGSAHTDARQAAHDLVGSLGSYGRPRGSVLAGRLEELLGHQPEAMTPAAQEEAAGLLAALEEEVAR